MNRYSLFVCNNGLQYRDIQGIHKRMMRFQKLTRDLFLTLHGHSVHRQQRQLSKFLMRYQQFASHAYCGAAGLVSKMASQQEKAFCVLRFQVYRSVITVQREFRARFRKHGVRGSQISRQSAHESGKVISPTHCPPLPPGNIPGTHFC